MLFHTTFYVTNRSAECGVKGNQSPYDGDEFYWSKRNSKLYDGATSKCLKRQDHSCGHCGLKFTDDEKIQLHHIDGNHDNTETSKLHGSPPKLPPVYPHGQDWKSLICREPYAIKVIRTDLNERGGV